jgi:FHA domain
MSKRNTLMGGLLIFLLLFSSALSQKVESLPRIQLPSGKKDNQVRNSKAIFVWRGTIYIGSAENNRVQVFKPNGEYTRSIPPGKKKDIEVAQDIDIGIDDILYVVDRKRDKVLKYDTMGVAHGQLGKKKTFGKPLSVAVAREGSGDGKVYVADYDKRSVFIFDRNGQSLGELTGATFDRPIAVDVDTYGRVYVLDRDRKSVFAFKVDGSFWGELPVSLGGETIEKPKDLCVNPYGEIFVIDSSTGSVYFISDFDSREWLMSFGGGTVEQAMSIDVVDRAKCYVLDNKTETIYKFFLDDLPPPPPDPTMDTTKVVPLIVQGGVEITTNIKPNANVVLNNIIRENKNLVVSVFEKQQEIVTGLLSKHFTELKYDQQNIKVNSVKYFSDINIDFILLIGTEGLDNKEIRSVRNAVKSDFLTSLKEAKHRVTIFTCADNIELVLPIESSLKKQKEVVDKIEFNGKSALIYDAFFEAKKYYDTLNTKNYPVYIMVTNSESKKSDINDFEELENLKRSLGLPQIYTLGYDKDKSSSMREALMNIADLSGGFFYSVNKQKSIDFLFSKTFELIKGQYLLEVDNDFAEDGQLAISVDPNLKGSYITSIHDYIRPTDDDYKWKKTPFLKKYGLIILLVLIGLILLIIIIYLLTRPKPKEYGEAMLEVKSGNAPQKMYQLSKGSSTIGANKSCFITLQVEGISQNHAVIEYSGGKYELVDTDSTNGTFVNRNRVTRRILINDDVISIGSAVDFVFKTG